VIMPTLEPMHASTIPHHEPPLICSFVMAGNAFYYMKFL
jgi:hypothetical protein